ncbi:MAG TPA: hypothetical protein VFH78_10405 [Candidatus Thermoplasmatota archaeon]|nr:hypothetical protein [Candidatus Thermoplasmatota archaeon]
MRPGAAWQRVPPWARWPLAYVALASLAALVGWRTVGVGDALFAAGALAILASIPFVGLGGERRFRVLRGLFGQPIALEERDPAERRRQISLGMKVFLLGLALWAPLLYPALR